MKTVEQFRHPFFVVNPHSANGSTWRDWPAIAELARQNLPNMSVGFTSEPYDAPEITREALRKGADLIVSVGGDGTLNEVVNGFFEDGAPVNPEAVLGVLSRGTGGDFRRTLGLARCIGKDIPTAVKSLSACRQSPCDVGLLTYTDERGRTQQRYFINITSFGIGGEVDFEVNRASKALGGKASFLLGSVRASLRYRNRDVRVVLDGREIYNGAAYNIAVCNGRYFGGGMMIAPDAQIDDGLFDVVVCGDFHFGDALKLGRTVYSGTHLKHPKITVFRGKRVEAYSDERVLLDVDGEQPGRLNAEFDILPSAIQVLRL